MTLNCTTSIPSSVSLCNCAMLYKLKPIVLQNARSRRSVTGRSHTRNTEVEHVHGHATASDGVIMAHRVTDPAKKVSHAREVAHVREADHVTETVTVLVDVTGIDTRVTAEAGVVTVTMIEDSVTLSVTATTRSEKGCPPRHWGKLISRCKVLFSFKKRNKQKQAEDRYSFDSHDSSLKRYFFKDS